MQIDIISDFTCPWCVIGKERLFKVLAMRPNFKVSINWRPFQLHTDIPPKGVDFLTYYSKKFGGKSEAKNHINSVREAGFAEGVQFRYDHIKTVPNTLKAHTLQRLAKDEGKSNEMVEALFSAYFVEGKDIGDLATLLEIAKTQGLENEAIEEELTGGSDDEESKAIAHALVKRDVAAAVQMGIRVVPSFILNKQYVVTGVKEPFDLLKIIETAYSEFQEAEEEAPIAEETAASSEATDEQASSLS